MSVAQSEILIDAPIERVWSAMTRFDEYPKWNSFVRKIDAPTYPGVTIGAQLALHVHFANGKEVLSVEAITRFEPPQRAASGALTATLEYEFLGWLSTLYLVRGRRIQTLEAVSPTTTRYFTYERLRGLLAGAAPIGLVQKGFDTHAANLKAFCERTSV